MAQRSRLQDEDGTLQGLDQTVSCFLSVLILKVIIVFCYESNV